jgi:hypothetical protein
MTLVVLVASAWAVTPKDLLAHPRTRYFNDYAQVVKLAISGDPGLPFRAGNYDEGFRQGLAAADDEYQGAGKTAAEQNAHNHGISGWTALVLLVLLVLVPVSTVILAFRLGQMYRKRRSRGDRTGGGDAE